MDPLGSGISKTPYRLHCLTPEQMRRVKEKVSHLLNERKFEEASRLMIAAAVANTDPEKMVEMLMDAAKEYTTKRAKDVLDVTERELKRHASSRSRRV